MALNYADIGIRVLPSYAGDVLADQIRPDRPGAKTPGVDTPLPGKGEAGSFVRFATTPTQEVEVDLTVDYGDSDDSGGIAGTAYPVSGAKPFELNITAINTAQVDPAAYSPASASSFKEWLTSKVDERLGTNYTFNPITGGYRPTGPGGGVAFALPGIVGIGAQFGAASSQRALENVASRAYAGEKGYAVAYVNGRVVGVSPGLFGGYTLSGQLPANLSPKQRQDIVRQILDIPTMSAAGAYRPEGMTAGESIAGAGKPFDGETVPLPADTSPLDSGYTAYEPSNDASYFAEVGGSSGGSSGNQYSVSDPVNTSPAQDFSYTSYEPSFSSQALGDTTSGRVGFAEGGEAIQGNGFVEGSPDNYTDAQTVADDEYRQVRSGSFVMNAPMTEKLQEAGLLPRGVDNSAKKSTIKADEGGMIDVALSKGEYVFEPEEAEEIGYDVLNKINDMGKPEVDRRQAARGGGFINGYQAGGETLPTVLPQSKPTIEERDVEGPFTGDIPLSSDLKSKYQTFLKSKRRRKDVEDLIDSMSDQERLFTVGLAETSASADSVESMMGVMQTAVNRAKTNRKRFEDVNNIADVLKQRSGRGTGSKMFQYDGLDPTLLGTRIQEIVDGKSPKGVTKLSIASDNVLNPEYEANLPLPFDVMYYTKPDAPMAPRFENNPETRYVTSFGGHDYYALEAAPESPDQQRIYDKMIREGKI